MATKKGFSLVEVLVFVTVLAIFFVTALTITTFSLRNLKIQEHKILATRYAEEGLEWIKAEKEDDWQVFAGRTDNFYCLNSLGWVAGICNSFTLGTPSIFKRDLIIRGNGNPIDRVTAELTVTWQENGIDQKVVLKSVYKLWE